MFNEWYTVLHFFETFIDMIVENIAPLWDWFTAPIYIGSWNLNFSAIELMFGVGILLVLSTIIIKFIA